MVSWNLSDEAGFVGGGDGCLSSLQAKELGANTNVLLKRWRALRAQTKVRYSEPNKRTFQFTRTEEKIEKPRKAPCPRRFSSFLNLPSLVPNRVLTGFLSKISIESKAYIINLRTWEHFNTQSGQLPRQTSSQLAEESFFRL